MRYSLIERHSDFTSTSFTYGFFEVLPIRSIWNGLELISGCSIWSIGEFGYFGFHFRTVKINIWWICIEMIVLYIYFTSLTYYFLYNFQAKIQRTVLELPIISLFQIKINSPCSFFFHSLVHYLQKLIIDRFIILWHEYTRNHNDYRREKIY